MVSFSISSLLAVGFDKGRINHPKKEGLYLHSGKCKMTWKVERRIKGTKKTHKSTLGTFVDSKRSVIMRPDEALKVASVQINLCDQGIDPRSTHSETDGITLLDVLSYHLKTNCAISTHENTELIIRRLKEDWKSGSRIQKDNVLGIPVRHLRKSHIRQIYNLFQPYGPRSSARAVEKISAAIAVYNEGELNEETAFVNYALRFIKKDMDPSEEPELSLFDDESASRLIEALNSLYEGQGTTFIQKNSINAALLMLHTGVRGNEALKIELDRIENHSYKFLPNENKGRRTRYVYFSKQAREIISRQKSLIENRSKPINGCLLLFQGLKGKLWLKNVNDMIHFLGFEQTSHSLRHYHNSVGQELGTISQRLLEVMHGHSSGRNVNEKIYTHFQEKVVRDAFQKISNAIESVFLRRTDPEITPDIIAGWYLAEEFLDLSTEGKLAFFERAQLLKKSSNQSALAHATSDVATSVCTTSPFQISA